MAKLTPEQISFLQSHGLTADDMFDGSKRSKRDREAAMEAVGKRFYFGGASCAAAHHTLRSKRGQCIQCKPQEIAYARRYAKPGEIYVAGSKKGRCVKVGVAEYAADRERHLRSEEYGSYSDWKILASTNTVDGAGRIEAAIQKQLAHFSISGSYEKGGARQDAREMFRCNFATAAVVVSEVMPKSAKLSFHCSPDEAKLYEWS